MYILFEIIIFLLINIKIIFDVFECWVEVLVGKWGFLKGLVLINKKIVILNKIYIILLKSE